MRLLQGLLQKLKETLTSDQHLPWICPQGEDHPVMLWWSGEKFSEVPGKETITSKAKALSGHGQAAVACSFCGCTFYSGVRGASEEHGSHL